MSDEANLWTHMDRKRRSLPSEEQQLHPLINQVIVNGCRCEHHGRQSQGSGKEEICVNIL